MKLICFEDQFVSQLQPITYARPAYAITCASYQLIDWLRLLPGEISVSVRNYLAAIEQLDAGLGAPNDEAVRGEDVLLVNARLVPRVETLWHLQAIAKSTVSGVIRCPETGVILVARLAKSETDGFLSVEPDSGTEQTREVPSPFKKAVRKPAEGLQKLTGESTLEHLFSKAEQTGTASWGISASDLPVFNWPHEVVSWHMKEMPAAMNYRLEHGSYTETDDGVFVAQGVSIGKYAVVETHDGPILLDDNVNVGPFCFLSGPVYAGAGTRVIEHAALKDGVALGHTVKIGGEVEASVIEPYTNKQHHGFLGHSYLGSWINLGAGTCNSDLKNTYGKINIEYGGEKVSTGMQFLGCIMGDYSKTAINTSIFTGKVIGVCSMLYGFATSNVPSFVNYARLFGQQSLLPAEVMVNTQQRMFARRKVQQRDCDIKLIQDMYHLTAPERDITDPYSF
ncbi:putative sugar nucleotidyl transferase [Rhodopirellula sp. MGV]|uniref:putative sugar nucleotidyl transferase n=1 Tax=Rhodopirellula sp. MGV TaxID=2023130 RepID=UPI000B978EF7|nr:putative sugar nucleotidyl transferase [Rhodopirellula sp. MGV]OYP34956.1 glucose-1-phosphate thymidylyltransferase [Rhodopirellula sp. MGV]PNY38149.1 glucose-1-phosphate thymidylyltransferase [Rhodopirellula baltica]